MSAPQRTEWKPDDECDSCEACQLEFGFFRRRHHCRRCGGVFCNQCCGERIRGLHGYGDTSQRICATCKDGMAAIKEVGKMRPRERRICILGFQGVGKSTIFQQLCGGGGGGVIRSSANTNAAITNTTTNTINNNNNDHFALSGLNIAKTRPLSCRGSEYIFSVVDTIGQTGFEMFQPQYTIGTDAYLLVFNVADRNSFTSIPLIREKILNCGGSQLLYILVGNKGIYSGADGGGQQATTTHSGMVAGPSLSSQQQQQQQQQQQLTERQVTFDEAHALAERWGVTYCEINARRQRSVDELLTGTLLKKIVDREMREK